MDIITLEKEKILRKKCVPILKETPKYLNNLIHSMIELMLENNGCGIAAPQVGVNKRLFLAVLEEDIQGEKKNYIEIFINPVILEHSEEIETGSEGCLSVPGKYGEVERYKSIKIAYFDGKTKVTKTFEGYNARIIQHEYDHLSGVLYIDKAIRVLDKEADKNNIT